MDLYKIANLAVEMNSFGKTLEQSVSYKNDGYGEPDIIIYSNAKNLQNRFPHLTLDSCEYLSTGSSFYRQLLKYDGMLLHASAVVMDGKAYLFSAPCGTGKSTHTALWRKVFGDDKALILNDDKPALRLENGEFFAYGTPWSGKTNQNLNMRVPVAGICMLERGTENKIERYSGAKAVHAVLSQTSRSKDPEFMKKLLDLLAVLFEKVPVWRMECNMEPEAAIMSYTAMSGGKEIL